MMPQKDKSNEGPTDSSLATYWRLSDNTPQSHLKVAALDRHVPLM
jgi:hypothetical protein